MIDDGVEPIRIAFLREWTRKAYGMDAYFVAEDTDASELKQIASDYERGMNYCTYNMCHDDYVKLLGWINRTDTFEPEHKGLSSDDFRALCIQFEEGRQIVVFPEGKRLTDFNQYEILSEDSDLKELQQAAQRTDPEYSGLNTAAALPAKKRELLSGWLQEKQKQIPDSQAPGANLIQNLKETAERALSATWGPVEDLFRELSKAELQRPVKPQDQIAQAGLKSPLTVTVADNKERPVADTLILELKKAEMEIQTPERPKIHEQDLATMERVFEELDSMLTKMLGKEEPNKNNRDRSI